MVRIITLFGYQDYDGIFHDICSGEKIMIGDGPKWFLGYYHIIMIDEGGVTKARVGRILDLGWIPPENRHMFDSHLGVK